MIIHSGFQVLDEMAGSDRCPIRQYSLPPLLKVFSWFGPAYSTAMVHLSALVNYQ